MSIDLNLPEKEIKEGEKLLSDAIVKTGRNLNNNSDKTISKADFDSAFKPNLNKPDVENVFITSASIPNELITDDVTRFAKVTLEMTKLYAKKNHDYGNAFEKGIKDIGLKYAASRLYDKVNRFITFTDNNELLVKDEKVEDTLIDLANYSIMTIIAMRKSR